MTTTTIKLTCAQADIVGLCWPAEDREDSEAQSRMDVLDLSGDTITLPAAACLSGEGADNDPVADLLDALDNPSHLDPWCEGESQRRQFRAALRAAPSAAAKIRAAVTDLSAKGGAQ